MTRTATPAATAPAAAPATNGQAPQSRRILRANRVELTGRLKETPTLRYTKQGGVPVADVVLVTNEQAAQEVPVVAWREVAEYATELPAGYPLQVIGKVVVRTYNAEDGSERIYIEIAANQLLPVLDSAPAQVDAEPV